MEIGYRVIPKAFWTPRILVISYGEVNEFFREFSDFSKIFMAYNFVILQLGIMTIGPS